MALRKITNGNSVIYVPKSEQTKETDSKPKPTKAGSHPRKQNKNSSKNDEKMVKDFAAGEFGILERIMNYYFQLKNIQILWLSKRKRNHKRLLNSKWKFKCKFFRLKLQ